MSRAAAATNRHPAPGETRAGYPVLENPVNRERFLIHRTGANTDGELFECDLEIHPGGGSPMLHIHARQEEHVRVLSGTATYAMGRRQAQLAKAGSLVIPAGTPHRVWNASDDLLKIRLEFRPALQIERLFMDLTAFARNGSTDAHGRPRLPQRILLAAEHEIFAAGAPIVLQRLLVRALAPIVRAYA